MNIDQISSPATRKHIIELPESAEKLVGHSRDLFPNSWNTNIMGGFELTTTTRNELPYTDATNYIILTNATNHDQFLTTIDQLYTCEATRHRYGCDFKDTSREIIWDQTMAAFTYTYHGRRVDDTIEDTIANNTIVPAPPAHQHSIDSCDPHVWLQGRWGRWHTWPWWW